MRRKHVLTALIATLVFIALPSDASARVTNTRITSGPSGAVLTDSVSFTFSSPEGDSFECRLDGGGWMACSPPQAYHGLADGPHTFEVRVVDSWHHDPTPAVATFTVLTEPPETTISSAPSGTIATDSATLSFESSQPGSFQCRLDSQQDADWSPCGSPQAYSGLSDGIHAFEVRAVNEGGKVDPTPASASFIVDTTAPETTISSGPSGKIGVDSVAFSFVATEEASFECRFDSKAAAAWQSCDSPRSYADLADGPHSFEVRAIDAVGNVDASPALRDFVVDTAPPPLVAAQPIGPLKPVAGQTVNLEPVSGVVELQCPGEDEQSRLTSFKQVPVGCLINTRHGVVDLTASKGSSGELQGGNFWGGVFVVSQDEGDDQEVELKLAGRRMCERRGAARKPVAMASRAGGGGRKLWGSGKGNFKTNGSYGSATVRGTTWLVVDRCDSSTLIQVKEGTVWVRDFVKDKSLTITTGQQYIAKALIPRLASNQ